LADLDNQTGDPVFDRSLVTALAASLQQSQHINVFPRVRVQETLRRMNRSDTVRVDDVLGAEIAQRENVRVIIALSLERIDSVYLLTARIVDPASHADLRSASERAHGKPQVLDALDRLAHELRRELGESRLALARHSLPLEQATTQSLEALKHFTDGRVEWTLGHYDDAAAEWRAAL